MIKAPPLDSTLEADLHTLSRIPQGKALIDYLSQNRSNIMELMTQVNDETRLRQFQGASVVLGDLISVLTRIPE